MEEGYVTAARIGRQWNRTPDTARAWLKLYDLVGDAGTQALMARSVQRQAAESERLAEEEKSGPFPSQMDTESGELKMPISTAPLTILPKLTQQDESFVERPAAAPLAAVQPAHIIEEPADDRTAFDRLSARQQKAALILGDLNEKRMAEDVAKAVGVTVQTLYEWKREPLFMAAIMDLAQPQFLFEARMTTYATLLALVKSGKARSDDRRLLAELAGLIGQAGAISVNFTKVGWAP